MEATTGWRFVVEELHRVGAGVHLAESADTAALKGPTKHAKNDRADARHLRELLVAGRLPESWIAPAHILDARGCACATRWASSTGSASSASSRCSTTTAARSGAS